MTTHFMAPPRIILTIKMGSFTKRYRKQMDIQIARNVGIIKKTFWSCLV
jgi:hypothetical protein